MDENLPVATLTAKVVSIRIGGAAEAGTSKAAAATSTQARVAAGHSIRKNIRGIRNGTTAKNDSSATAATAALHGVAAAATDHVNVSHRQAYPRR